MASLLRRTLSRLTLSRARATRSGTRGDPDEAANSDWVLPLLWRVYRRAEDSGSDSFTRGEMSLWNVEITSFDPLNSKMPDTTSSLDPAAYFVPLPVDFHQKYPRIVDIKTEDDLNRYQTCLAPNYSPAGNGILVSAAGRSATLASRFCAEMSITRQDLDPDYGDSSLIAVTKWRFHHNFYIHGFPSSEVRSGSSIYKANTIFVNSRHVHVKLILSNAVAPEDEDDILRSELLIILAAMHSRLRVQMMLEHVVMPVMVFSFMPPSHVRVLMAIFDGQKIRISMSDPIPCSATSQDLYDTLVRYLAGGPNPNVDTKKFPLNPVDIEDL